MADERLNKLAKLLVEYSVEVKEGDIVYVCADEVATPWVIEVVKEATKKGAHIEYTLESDEIKEIQLKYGSEKQLKSGNMIYESILSEADVWLTAWGNRNTRMLSRINSDKLKMYQQGSSTWRKIYSDRTGDGSLRWCGTQYPTYADAQEASMSMSEYEDFVYGAGLLDSQDPVSEWKKISKEQERWVKYLDSKSNLYIVSEDTDIMIGIEGRKWINCDGKQNFPDGEIFTSPLENNINGYITFSFPGIFAGRQIEGIKLEVKDGKVVNAKAKKGEELLKSLLDTDEGSSFFGEVAIGTNYGIKDFTSNMLFDEKIGGTVHMAIGDSMPEAGGKNKSSLHWDMLCDMRNGGKIYADGELFYENGKFIDSILEKYNIK